MPDRLDDLKHWLESGPGFSDYTLKPASSDASFRRYFRVALNGDSFIVMDAPPAQEDTTPFIAVARLFLAAGLNVPEVIEADVEQGFLLLSDLGSELYLDVLDDGSADRLYGDALAALVRIQGCAVDGLPLYDRDFLLGEMELFREWLVRTHLGMDLTAVQMDMLDTAFACLADNAVAQPQVCVHRDYHSRNLMHTRQNNPGIIDFQDAMHGPLTYDLASLLRDCYIKWPRARVERWALDYQQQALAAGILDKVHDDPAQFMRWFDLMGAQRHLKAAGIFARLNHRDSKPGYLADIPRTLSYIIDIGDSHPDLAPLSAFIDKEVLTRLG